MSSPSATPDSNLPSAKSPAPVGAPAPKDPTQELRRQLILSEVRLRELQDVIEEKETARADAIALLAELELQLEAKVTYIVTLAEHEAGEKRLLAARIQELEADNRRLAADLDIFKQALVDADAQQHRVVAQLREAHEKNTADAATLRQQTDALRAAALKEEQLAANLAASLDKIARMENSFSWKLTARLRRLGGSFNPARRR